MLSLYLIALLVGGFLLALSIIGGHADSDADFDIDADVDVDADADGDGDFDHGMGAFDAMVAWLPFASLRFWTFFAAFFGLTGVVLEAGEFTARFVTLGVAIGIGYVCGAGMTTVVRRLRRTRVDSSLGADDFIGESARVILPVAPGTTGKVRLEIKGRVVELLAETEDEVALAAGQICTVYGVKEDGRAVVARAAELTE